MQDISGFPSPDSWSFPELMSVAIILVHIHALCSFVKGCGVLPSAPPSPSPQSDALARNGIGGGGSGAHKDSEVEVLMARMQELSQANANGNQAEEERARQFADINMESCKCTHSIDRCLF